MYRDPKRISRYAITVPRLTDNAICIRDLDWSESSQVVVLLTEAHGKVRGLAKGSRRNSPSAIAKFSGGINLLSAGQAVVTTKRATQLATVTEWDLQDDHYHLRTNLQAQWSAMYAADLTDAMLAEEDPHPGAYQALRMFLQQLATPANAPHALLRFQWDLLVDVGYRPELMQDVETGEALPDVRAYSFDPKLGGLTTRNGIHDEDWRVRANTVKLLRAISDEESTESFNHQAVSRANRLLCTYCRATIDKHLPTMGFILNDSKISLGNR
jgi:DNA repair protein RecO (recombination protein O)